MSSQKLTDFARGRRAVVGDVPGHDDAWDPDPDPEALLLEVESESESKTALKGLAERGASKKTGRGEEGKELRFRQLLGGEAMVGDDVGGRELRLKGLLLGEDANNAAAMMGRCGGERW